MEQQTSSRLKFYLVGNVKERIGYHQGLYTRSYQEARAVYDAKIRSWEIEYKDNLFTVKNNDGKEECVFYDRRIRNCSCSSFIEVECGTCMHIEAVRMVDRHDLQMPRVRPITFLDDYYQIQTLGAATGGWETPAIATLKTVKNSRTLPFSSIVYPDVDVFKEQGVTLFDFQIESVRLMLKNIKSVLVLKMGLGKTLCALACSKLLNLPKVIIVSPNSLKYQWQREINRFGLGDSIVISKRGDLAKYQNQRFLILSYEMLTSNKSLLNDKYDIIIADEIQKIKNQESEAWKTVTQIKADYIFALSGTPIQNNINDLLSLIHFLNPFELKPEWKFYEEYCDCTRARVLGIKAHRTDDLRRRLKRYIINPHIDYNKFKLPSKNEIKVVTSMSPEQKEVHDDYLDMAKKLIAKSMDHPLTPAERMMLNGMLTKARMAATDARLFNKAAQKSEKFREIEECLEGMALAKKKVVVYSEWIITLNLLHEFLNQAQIPYVEFNGTLPAKKRNARITKFIEDPDTLVFLSTDAGGLGIDGLQFVCQDVIHIEKIWNPMKIEQRNGRLIRALQKKDVVNVYYFEVDAEIENMITQNHARKHTVISEMLK